MSAPVSAETVRDTIVAAVSERMGVPTEQIMRTRGRRSEIVRDARAVTMWVLSADVDRLGVPELERLLGTTWQTIDEGWGRVLRSQRLLALASMLSVEKRGLLEALPKLRDEHAE
jgi:hypothetical protein